MNLNEMRHFVAIFRERSIKNAAEYNYISPQALSKTLIKIEKELNATLFLRSHNGLIPTNEGLKLYHRVSRILKEYEQISTDISLSLNHHSRTLRVPFTYGVLGDISIDFIQQFYAMYPSVHLDLFQQPDIPIIRAIETEDVALGIVTMPYDNIKFQGDFLYDQRHCLVLRKDHPLADKQTIDYEDLRGVPLAVKGREFSIFNSNTNKFLAHNVTPTIYLETSEEELINQFARTGNGVGVSLEWCARKALGDDLTIRFFKDETWVRRVAIIWKTGASLDAEEQVFYDFLVDWCHQNK